MERLISIAILMFGVCIQALAQDPMYSQVLFNKMIYNPAYTGRGLGLTGLVAHRNQWTAVPGVLNTSNLEVSTVLPKFNSGIGGMISHNVEGSGKLRYFSLDLMASQLVPIINKTNSKMFSYFGLGVGVNRKSINWDKLVFGDQLDPINGISNTQTLAQTPENNGHIYPDFNFGLAIKGVKNGVFYDFGTAVDHILEPNESVFQTADGRLPRKYSFNTFLGMPFNKLIKSAHQDYFFVPGFVLQTQKDFRTAILGANIVEKHFTVGAWYKSQTLSFNSKKNDALIFNAGVFGDFLKEYHYKIVYSYDMTINRLITNTAGTHEITLVWTYYSKQKYQSQKYSNCVTLEGPSELAMPFVW